MRKLFAALAALCVVFFGFAAVNVFAADVEGVYLDGQKLSFSDAQPIIVNSRVMVPVRETANNFGMTVDWNKETETMTFTKGSRVIVHKMYTNTITVNGEVSAFETPSINRMNRTLMPVRMLAESMGADVQWDSDARQVIITTDVPSVIRAEPSVSSASSGQTVLVSITASPNTESVKLVDNDSGAMVNEGFVYNENADGTRVFTLSWVPSASTTGFKTVVVYAGNSGGYGADTSTTQKVTVSVAADSSPQIKNYYISDYSVDRNDYVSVTVYATNTTTRVKIENDFNTAAKELTSYTTSGENRVFEGKIKMTKSGTRELTLYAGSSKGYNSTYTTVNIDVDKDSSSDDDDDDDDDDDCSIKDVDVSDDEIGVGGQVTVKVTTTYDVEEVAIYDDDDNRLTKTIYESSKSKSDNKKVWSLDVDVDDEGSNKFYVYAYADKDETYKTFKVKGVEYDDDELAIISITQKTTGASEGDTVSFSAVTTLEASYIEVEDYKGNVVASVSSGTRNGNTRVWTFKISDAMASKNYVLYAFDSNDDDVNKKFTVDVDEEEDLEITDVDVEETDVDIYDKIKVEVRTTTSATKVWIEDPDGDKVKSSSKYDKKDDDEYVWKFTFEATDSGRITYTVYAEDDDDNTTKKTFKVTVDD